MSPKFPAAVPVAVGPVAREGHVVQVMRAARRAHVDGAAVRVGGVAGNVLLDMVTILAEPPLEASAPPLPRPVTPAKAVLPAKVLPVMVMVALFKKIAPPRAGPSVPRTVLFVKTLSLTPETLEDSPETAPPARPALLKKRTW